MFTKFWTHTSMRIIELLKKKGPVLSPFVFFLFFLIFLSFFLLSSLFLLLSLFFFLLAPLFLLLFARTKSVLSSEEGHFSKYARPC